MEDYQGALVDFERALGQDSENATAYYGRGFAKSKLGNTKSAIEDFNKAISIGNIENNKVFFSGSITKQVLDNLRNNVQERLKMAEMSLERSEVYYNRGLSKARNGEAKTAIEDYNKAIALNPTYSEAYFTRGMLKSQTGDQRGAIQDCTNAIKLNSKYAEAYYVRGVIRHALGDTDGCNDLSKSGELGYTPAYAVIRDYCN